MALKVYPSCKLEGNRTLYEYSGEDHEIEKLAGLCLERTPPFHKWYFETIHKKTFGFLIDDGYVYFTIVDEGLQNRGVLPFLEQMRDEFRSVTRKGSRGSFSGKSSAGIQEKLVPVIRRLITSLEHVSNGGNDWKAEIPSSDHAGASPSPSNASSQLETSSSTKAPLLGKSSKQKLKKLKDQVIAVRDIELEEHRKSTDRVKIESTALDSNNQNGSSSSISLQKDLGSMRIRSGSQNIQKKWWRLVRIVLAIDAVVCLLLFVIWLYICKGVDCTRS